MNSHQGGKTLQVSSSKLAYDHWHVYIHFWPSEQRKCHKHHLSISEKNVPPLQNLFSNLKTFTTVRWGKRSPGSSCGCDINLQITWKRSLNFYETLLFSFVSKGVGPDPRGCPLWGGGAASAHTASGLWRELAAGPEHRALTVWGGIAAQQEHLLHKSQDLKKKKS